MSKEQQPGDQPQQGVRVSRLMINLEERSLTVFSRDNVLAKLTLDARGVVFEAGRGQPMPPSDVMPIREQAASLAASVPAEAPSSHEKPTAVTLTGRLKSKPRPGRPDSRGNPTAWARFAAHEEDREGAHMYSTTFHKRTAPVALGLDKDAKLTLQGYPHESDDPGNKRMDTLSVINLLDYPGKPEK